MKPIEIALLAGAAFIGLNMISTKVSAFTGEVVGETTGNVVSGAVVGLTKGIFVNPYEWAKSYDGYIPIIDPLAKTAAGFKDLGDPDHWFW